MKKLSAILLAVALVVMMVPTVWGADTTVVDASELESALTSAASGDTITLTVDANLTKMIPSGVTLKLTSNATLTVPNDGNLTTLLSSNGGTIVVEAGSGLTIAGINMVGTGGNLELADGELTADLSNLTGKEIRITVNGSATVPAGEKWTTTAASLGGAKLNTTIAAGATLTVKGEFRAANGSSFALNGNAVVNGVMRIGSSTTVSGNGSITVNNGAVLALSADPDNLGGISVALANGGVVLSNAQVTIPNSTEENAGGYSDSRITDDEPAATVLIFPYKYTLDTSVPNPNPGTPTVNRPSFTIVQRPAVEYWASPESSNPTEEWAEPTTPSTDDSKTNPSMGGRADA